MIASEGETIEVGRRASVTDKLAYLKATGLSNAIAHSPPDVPVTPLARREAARA